MADKEEERERCTEPHRDESCGVSGEDGSDSKEERESGRGKVFSPSRVEFPAVEPWPEAVDGSELLDGLLRELQRFVVFPKWAAEALALWILHTYAFRLREVTTYMGIESPDKECGKSTLLTVLSRLVDRPAVSSNISSSAFFRVIEELQPTLLIDEADTNFRGRDELTGILNAGYTKSTAFVWRICYEAATSDGKPGEAGPGEAGNSAGRVARYSCWCPKAIAAIGHLHPTLASRCVVIRMHRKMAGEQCERLKRLESSELKRKCARFVADHGEAIGRAEPAVPAGLANRAADVWEPLLALADLAGGQWPERAREAAVGLTARAQEHSPIGSLLMDLLMAFIERGADRMFSRDLVADLLCSVERPWLELRRGKPITVEWLAQQLRPYGIRPKTIRIGEVVAKGYAQEDFAETFRRYIPKSEVEALRADLAARTVKGEEANGLAEKGETRNRTATQSCSESEAQQ